MNKSIFKTAVAVAAAGAAVFFIGCAQDSTTTECADGTVITRSDPGIGCPAIIPPALRNPSDPTGGDGGGNTFTITFNANNGSVSPTSGTTGTDGKLTYLPTPTRSGYTFAGWYTAETGGANVTTGTVFSGNSAIYARWEASVIPPSRTLQNSDMTYVISAIPIGQTPYITGAQLNGSAVAGGSSSITVTSSEPLSELYFKIAGENGYYVRLLTAADLISSQNGNYAYFVNLLFSQQLDGGQLQFVVSGITAQSQVSSGTENSVQIIKAGTGALQVSLSWDKNDDLDLHIFTPSGTEVYWSRKMVGATANRGKIELDVDSNPGCSIDGINTENIYLESPLEDGEYRVRVCLYERCISGTGAKYNVSANSNGNLINFSTNQSGQFAAGDDDKCVDIGTINIRSGYYAGF